MELLDPAITYKNQTSLIRATTILDKMDEKLRPPLPHFNDGKNGAFSL